MNEQELLHIIEEASQNRITTLDLSNKELEELPPEIGQLTYLNELYLSGNKLTALPSEIGRLTRLTELDLSSNKLITLVPEIGQLIHLNELNLRGNQLATLLPEIGQLIHLNELDLRSNKLTDLPSEIGYLTQLNTLYLSYNHLTTLPPEIGQLSALNKLHLRNNQLITLPSEIGSLIHLNKLLLSSNQLEVLPLEIGQLTSLTELHLINNQLKALPPEIGQLRLAQLTLDGNPLELLPLEIREQDTEAILNFFRQQLEQDVDYLYEAKLLIVGEAGAGKTTLAKKIQNPEYKLNLDENSTEGIEIANWYFLMDDGKEFRVNIWDFGGQEVYYATHQFFLTKRSLYVLVADSRKEDTDFNYWLSMVDLLSNKSPLLIVKNERQDRQRDINEQQLQRQFTHLKETIATNLFTNRNLSTISKAIKYHIQDLPHIGTELPKSWVKVRETLENDPRNYISQEEYLHICQNNGFTKLKDKLQLSSYLHDLGVCLHFQNDDLLKEIIILKTSWGTDAVYRVLDSPEVIQNKGKFDRSTLGKIWEEEKYALMQAKLLQLMINFKLCYEIPSCPGVYIAPQLLSSNQPEYAWDESDNLLLEYEYGLMPKGILTRFIVEMHPWIEDQALVWKSGVVIAKEQARAEIIENYRYYQGKIRIRVEGKRKRDLLVTVMHELDKIHHFYENLKPNIQVPCKCEICKGSQTPYFYLLQWLHQFLDMGREQIQCYVSTEMVSVWALINDIIPEQTQLEFHNSDEQNVTNNSEQSANIAIHIHNQNTQENQNLMSNTYQSHSGSGDNVARDKITTNISNSQNLAQAAKDIKTLLDQLSQDYPSNTPSGQMMLSAKALEEIEKNPTVRQRVVGALKEAGATALEEAINHPVAKVLVAGAKGFIDAS